MNARFPRIAFVFAAIVMLLPTTLTSASVLPAFVAQPVLAPAATCTVTSTADSGPGTLRQCLLSAVNGDIITFSATAFPPANPATITLTDTLPTINQGNLTIDASNAGVIVDGSQTITGTSGLVINSSNNLIRGTQIMNFPLHGIWILPRGQNNTIGGDHEIGDGPMGQGNLVSGSGRSGIKIDGVSNRIMGSYVGTNATGTVALPNRGAGIQIVNGAMTNTVGGNTPGTRNLISGNSWAGVGIGDFGTSGNVVIGNYIGTDFRGVAALPNGDGVEIGDAQSNRIGGSAPGEGNVISGNNNDGVRITDLNAVNNIVSGNFIGTNASGTAALANRGDGVRIVGGASNNIIGGSTDAQRNVISGSNNDGVGISGANTTNNIIIGNFIGTNATGMAALPNATHGVSIRGGASYNVIGGNTDGKRNIISGNGNSGVSIEGSGTVSNTIIGNYMGANVTGSVAITNTYNDVAINSGAQYNIVGGTTANERNILSGSGNGVYIGDAGTMYNVVIGNYIGTDASGTKAIGHYWQGVCIRNGAQHNRIGGTAPGERNIISGSQNGVQIGGGPGTDENQVIGNYIGIDAIGTTALGNNSNGVYIWEQAARNRVEANVIGGNSNGVWIAYTGTMTNAIVGNFIGTDASGLLHFPNWRGIGVDDGAQHNVLGPGNVVAYNRNGIRVIGPTTLYNTITRNSIHDNADVTGPAIDNVSGGNTELLPPVITQITGGNIVAGSACAGCTVEIFSDDAEEGRIFEGSTTADGSGHFSFYKPGGFTGPNVTATATDAGGNTSEFSAPVLAVLPLILQVMPNQGTNDVPNEINIYGLHFASGITASLGTTPPISLAVQFLATTHLRATIPAGLLPGTFDLTVSNPNGGTDTLQDAYTVFASTNDDLFGYSNELWTDPPTLRAGEQGGIGLVVHRQGGKSVLSDVTVRFYQGNPSQGGTVIGDGLVLLLSPRSLESTSEVNWTPPHGGRFDLYAVIDPDNAVTETYESNNVVSRTVTVLAAATDQIAPHVDSFAINDGAAYTRARDVTLDATASDNAGGSGVASMLYLEFEYSQGARQWIPAQNSGWVTYSTASSNYPWRLLPVAGTRYMQAWAADAAGNISLYPYRAYINYVPPSDHVGQGQVRVYRQTVGAGQTLTVRVTPISGDPDLYVWPPDWPIRPPWVSYSSSGVDEVSFSAPANGVYQIEVYGYTAADYQISISLGSSQQQLVIGEITLDKTLRDSPALPVSSVPGEQMALPPAVPRQYHIYLPVVLRAS